MKRKTIISCIAPSAPETAGRRLKRAAMTLLTALLTATTVWAQDAITGLTYNSTGGYYEISDAQDLVDLANYVNGGNNASGKTFKQTQDIDMSSIGNFTPIGKSFTYTFSGTYDGDNKTIANMTINSTDQYKGLFGYPISATIRKVCLVSPSITSSTNNGSIGAVVAFAAANDIQDCSVVNPTFNVSNVRYCGAVIGCANYATVSNCYFYDANTEHDYQAIGHIDGENVSAYGRVYKITATGCTATATPTVTISTTSYYKSGTAVTLSHADREGYTIGYTVNGTAIDGNTFTIGSEDAAIAATVTPDPAHFTVNGAGTEYTIKTTEGWNVFCDLLADNAMGYFSSKTVRLGADITVTRMAGGSNHAFTGTFDGGGHTLTLDYGTADAPVDAQFVAPFVETAADGDHQPTFRNLTIDGTIYATHTQATDHDHVGGLIGHLFGTVAIEHCTSNVSINATSGAGGFVGLCEHSVSFTDCHSAAVVRSAGGNNSGFVAWSRSSYWNINFTGCLFDGKLLQQNGNGASNGGFIGWKGDAKIVNITNCLCAPTPLAAGETMASSNSATFSREHANYAATIQNCYYTAAFDIAQGKATHTVTAGADVTIGGIALTGDATQYTVSGITAYSGGGLRRGETLYYGSDDQLSLTLTTSAVCPQPGYRYDGYVASAGTLSGTTLTMPDEDVTISVNTAGALLSTRQPVTVAFINADGTTGEASAIALDGHETRTSEFGSQFVDLAAGWYYVGTDIDYTGITLRPQGNITLILADGCTMHIGTAENRTGVTGIQRGTCDLTIYGQSLDAAMAGTISYEGTGSKGFNVRNYTQQSGNVSISNSLFTGGSGLEAGSVTLNGGKLSVATNSKNAIAIWTSDGDITINGGQLDATATGSGDIYGLYAGGTNSNITLGWTRPDDRITASSYYATGTVKVADGQALTDGSGNIYTGTLTDLAALGGKTLQPCLALADAADNTDAIDDHASQTLAVALSGRALYKDGSWNTLCLPFSVSTASGTLSGDNVQAMTLNTASSTFADGTLTLNFDAATTIPAGTPFIIKWDNTGVNIENPVFEGVTVSNATNDATIAGVLTFTGTYAPVSIADGGDNTKLYLGKQNTLYYPNTAMTIGTHRAYFQLLGDLTAGEPAGGIEQGDDVEDPVRAFVLNFGDDEATGIVSAEANSSLFTLHSSLSEWYTLDGRKLDGKPTQRGIYISNGNKIVIK